jgi:hypothetical protein
MAADFTVTGRPGADHTGQPTGTPTDTLTGWPRGGLSRSCLAPDMPAAIYELTSQNAGFPRQLCVRVTIARANLVVAVAVMTSRGLVRSFTVRDAAHLVPEPYLIGAVDIQGEPDRP